MEFFIPWIFPSTFVLYIVPHFSLNLYFSKMASTSGKRCTLSTEQKLEILEVLKSKKADDVAKDFNIGYSTVKKIRQTKKKSEK